MANQIRIERTRIEHSPQSGRNYRTAWHHIYSVYGSNGAPLIEGTERLSIARRIAKQAAKGSDAEVVCTWEDSPLPAHFDGCNFGQGCLANCPNYAERKRRGLPV